jgi:hypothetical protein
MGVDAQGCDTDKMDDGVAIPGRDGCLERMIDHGRTHSCDEGGRMSIGRIRRSGRRVGLYTVCVSLS